MKNVNKFKFKHVEDFLLLTNDFKAYFFIRVTHIFIFIKILDDIYISHVTVEISCHKIPLLTSQIKLFSLCAVNDENHKKIRKAQVQKQN